MAFKIVKGQLYSWPVSLEQPVNGGKFETVTFEVTFKKISQSKLKELLYGEDASDQKFCKEVVAGWLGVQDANGHDLNFHENFESVIDEPGVARAIATAYLESVAGARAKN